MKRPSSPPRARLRRHVSRLAPIASLLLAGGTISAQAVIIFSDDFQRAASDSLGSTPTGGFAWNEIESAAGGIKLNAGKELRAGGTSQRLLATVNLSSALAYKPVLDNNSTLVTWTFNLSGMSGNNGFDDGERGTAFLLAGSQASTTDGQGYAVAYGDPGSVALRLVRYSGGLDADANLSTLITTGDIFASTSGHRFGVKVTFNPKTDAWSFYVAEAAWTGAEWPAPDSGTFVGAFKDSTFTGGSLPYTGVFYNASSSSGYAYADNITLKVDPRCVVPEPGATGLAVGIGLLGLAGWYRRQDPR